MDRYDISNRRVLITVEGLDVSAAVLSWAVGREAIGFEAAPTVGGELVLSPALAEPLNPKDNTRWQPGGRCKIRIEDEGSWADLPFGGDLVIVGAAYQSEDTALGVAPRPEQLTLELADRLGDVREPERPRQLGGITLGEPISVTGRINQLLQTKNLGLNPQGSDPVPTGFYLRASNFDGSGSLVDWIHKRLWCQQDGNFGLWQDSQGRIRIFKVQPDANPYIVLSADQVPSLVPIIEQRERLAGEYKTTSTHTIITTRPTSSTYSAVAEDTKGTLLGYDKVTWDLRFFSETTETRKYRRKGAALKGEEPDNDTIFESERTRTVKSYDRQGRNDATTTTVWLPRGNVDEDLEGNTWLTEAQQVIVINTFGRTGVITDRKTITKKAKGLLGLEGTATNLVVEQIFYESWDKIGKLWRYYPRIIYNADVQRLNQYTGAVPSGGGPGSRPPGPDTRPDRFDVEERTEEHTIPLSYSGTDSRSGELDLNGRTQLANGLFTFTGYGTYSSNPDRLDWNGTGPTPPGTYVEINGTYTGNGYFRGNGNLKGNGSWQGQRQPARTLPLDYGDHPPSLSALKSTAQLEAHLMAGRYHGVELELSISDIPPQLPPGRVVEVNSDRYLLSGEILSGAADRVRFQATGLWVGRTQNNVLVPVVEVIPQYLSTQGGRLDLSTQAGEEILI